MKFLNFFKRKVNAGSDINSEDKYYEQLFVNNPKWNKPDPNGEELMRWHVIERFVKDSIEKISNENETSIKILDLGSGRGWLTNLLTQYGTVTGLEPVEPVVNYAKRLFPKIEFVFGTSETLIENLRGTEYDLIVSSEVIEHIPDEDKDKFIDNIKKLLKKDGFLILTTPRKEAQEEWHKYLKANQPIEDWISEEELEQLLLRKGFSKHGLERIPMIVGEGGISLDVYQAWLFQKK